MPLYLFKFSETDTIEEVCQKYFAVMPEFDSPPVVSRAKEMFEKTFADEEVGELGSSLAPLCGLKGEAFIEPALKELEKFSSEVLDYKFKDPRILLAAVTHPSAKSHYRLSHDYEKLEALGDAILDYVITINMIRYTMFERYQPQYDQPDLSVE